jgi:hypothetical protein
VEIPQGGHNTLAPLGGWCETICHSTFSEEIERDRVGRGACRCRIDQIIRRGSESTRTNLCSTSAYPSEQAENDNESDIEVEIRNQTVLLSFFCSSLTSRLIVHIRHITRQRQLVQEAYTSSTSTFGMALNFAIAPAVEGTNAPP